MGRLVPEAAEPFKAHIESCLGCRQVYEETVKFVDAICAAAGTWNEEYFLWTLTNHAEAKTLLWTSSSAKVGAKAPKPSSAPGPTSPTVDAGIKRQNFRRFCRQRNSHRPGRSYALYSSF